MYTVDGPRAQVVKLERTIQLHERTSPTHSQGHIVAWGGVTSHRLQTRKPTESAELWVKYPEHVHAFTHTHTLFCGEKEHARRREYLDSALKGLAPCLKVRVEKLELLRRIQP
jgi:hypothetical protein